MGGCLNGVVCSHSEQKQAEDPTDLGEVGRQLEFSRVLSVAGAVEQPCDWENNRVKERVQPSV